MMSRGEPLEDSAHPTVVLNEATPRIFSRKASGSQRINLPCNSSRTVWKSCKLSLLSHAAKEASTSSAERDMGVIHCFVLKG